MVIPPQQSNHHPYILPEVLKGTPERKLYMNIATWAMKQNKAVCSQSVAESFGISIRQATNILSIIHRRYSDTIESTVKKVKIKGVARTYMTVTNINPKCRKTPAPRKSNIDNNQSLSHWENVFLSVGAKNRHPATRCANNGSTTATAWGSN